MALRDEILAAFPWLASAGLFSLLDGLIVEGATPQEIVAQVRNSKQYATAFPGIVDAKTGVMRFTSEREYLDRIEDYRTVLRTWGRYDPANDNPFQYVDFIEQGIDPNTLNQRFEVYDQLEAGSEETRAAFYVYAGLNVTVDDLYQAVVSPQFRQELMDKYDQSVASQPLDYAVWIQRAAQFGMSELSKKLKGFQKAGLLTGQVVSSLLATNPEFAQQMMGALFTGGEAAPSTGTLALSDLMKAFEYAMIAGAASEVGLQMPTKERLEQFRQAGVQRRQALQVYGQFGSRSSFYKGAGARAGIDFGQEAFEDALFLGRGTELAQLTSAEQALGRAGGGFALAQDRSGRVVQVGRSVGGSF